MGFFNSIWQILLIVGSLGIFIFGMKMMSEGIQKLAGQRLRQILRSMTDHPIKGIFTGFVTTSLVQSSSATTVMVVSFVNAGLLTLIESFGIIMGANIGTTLTSWIVNYAGLKVKIAPIAIGLIGLTFPLLFAKKTSLKSLAEFVIGFGILFIGLDFLKDSVPDLNDPANYGILEFMNRFTNLGFLSTILFVLLGTLLTVVVQSSSASTAITLLMVANGWISFPLGAAMILGENIGTTITANIAALIANNNAKRAARFHFLFNMTGVVWMLAVMPLVINLIMTAPLEDRQTIAFDAITVSDYVEAPPEAEALAAMQSSIAAGGIDPESIVVMKDQQNEDKFMLVSGRTALEAARATGIDEATITLDAPNDRLPLFHTFFNIANVLLLAWFLPFFSRMVYKWIPLSPDDDDEDTSLQYIGSGLLETPELSIEEARKETAQFGLLTQKMYNNVISLLFGKPKNVEKMIDKIRRREEITDQMEIEIANFLSEVSEKDISASGSHRIQSILNIANDLERIGDICFRLAVAQEKMSGEKVRFTEELKPKIRELFDFILNRIKVMNQALGESYSSLDLEEAQQAEVKINEMRESLNREIFSNLEKGRINAVQSITFLNLINSAERIGDHIINVCESMAGMK